MQRDIEKLEALIENLDYSKNADADAPDHDAKEETEDGDGDAELLNIEKIVCEHGSLQNDNRDLALEIVVQQETNAKLSQSVNDLWLFANQLLLKLEKHATWKRYSTHRVAYISEQLSTFKKMYHRTRFFFVQLTTDYKRQIHELRRVVSEVLHQSSDLRERTEQTPMLKLQLTECARALKQYEAQTMRLKHEKQAMIQKYEALLAQSTEKAIKTQTERDILLEKLDSLMTKHSL